jgi:hypothetical protein
VEGANAELWRDGLLVASAPVAGGVVRFPRDATGSPERYRIELYVDGARATVTGHVLVHGVVIACANGSGSECGPGGCCDGGGGGSGGGAGGALAGLFVALALARRRRPLV